ncbi:hypothetical protein AB2N08_16180 [Massilia aurea]|uniref:hypothetical protein n=1 Tax=Massilia aurea TaxID=373040 RepID=UPI003461ACD9
MDAKHGLAAVSALAQETRLGIFRLLSQAGLVMARQESRFVIYIAEFATMAFLSRTAAPAPRAASTGLPAVPRVKHAARRATQPIFPIEEPPWQPTPQRIRITTA